MHILLNWLVQGAVVAAATAGGLRLMRGAPAATRYAVCWAALAAILSLPFVPSLWAVVGTVAPAPVTPAVAAELLAANDGAPVPLVRLPAAFSAASVLLGTVWLLWTMLQSVRVVRDVRWLQRARRRCRALPAVVAARFSPVTRHLVANTRAEVVLCDAVRAAAVLGGGRPIIGLQRRLVHALSDRELNAVLVHELAHVVRRDSVATVAQRAVHVLVGWHPGVWWVMRRLALEREMACDEAALSEAGGPKAYASCLARIAGLAPRAVLSPDLALGMLPSSGLRRRVIHVLTPGRFSRRTASWASGTLSTSLCAIAIAIGTVAVFGEPAVAERVAAFEHATARLVQPLQQVLPAPRAQVAPRVTTSEHLTRSRASTSVRVTHRADTAQTQAPAVIGAPMALNLESTVTGAEASQSAVTPSASASNDVAPEATASGQRAVDAPSQETAPQAAAPPPAPNATHDRTVTDMAVAAAAGATDAWNATTDAAAGTGVAVGRKTQKGAVATAGAFTRWGRRIASSF